MNHFVFPSKNSIGSCSPITLSSQSISKSQSKHKSPIAIGLSLFNSLIRSQMISNKDYLSFLYIYTHTHTHLEPSNHLTISIHHKLGSNKLKKRTNFFL